MCVTILSFFQSTSKTEKSSGMSRYIIHHIQVLLMMINYYLRSNSLFPPADSKSRKEKLEQVASFSLFGNVMSMASVQLVGASRDALLLSFKDAKVSLSKLCACWSFNIKIKVVFSDIWVYYVVSPVVCSGVWPWDTWPQDTFSSLLWGARTQSMWQQKEIFDLGLNWSVDIFD